MAPPAAVAVDDPSSQSNPAEARVVHADLALCVDFGSRRVVGTASLRVRTELAGVQQLRLDTRDLRISSATWQSASDDASSPAAFALADAHPTLGACLTVALPPGLAAGATGVVTLAFATSPDSSACQWLTPEQTAGGQHPYLFTQCQAIHARSLLPVQDCPAAKLTCVCFML
jgi:leukotriene-A4 hydrolase